jgi:hypothetical protein
LNNEDLDSAIVSVGWEARRHDINEGCFTAQYAQHKILNLLEKAMPVVTVSRRCQSLVAQGKLERVQRQRVRPGTLHREPDPATYYRVVADRGQL